VGLRALGETGSSAVEAVRDALGDAAPVVRVAAADALCKMGRTADSLPTLRKTAADPNEWVRLEAANVLDRTKDRSAETTAVLQQLEKDTNQHRSRVPDHGPGQ